MSFFERMDLGGGRKPPSFLSELASRQDNSVDAEKKQKIIEFLNRSFEVLTAEESQCSDEELSDLAHDVALCLDCIALEEYFISNGRIDLWVSLIDGCQNLQMICDIVESFAHVLLRGIPITHLISEPSMLCLLDLLCQFSPALLDTKQGVNLLKNLLLICCKLVETETCNHRIVSTDFTRGLVSLFDKDLDVDVRIIACIRCSLLKSDSQEYALFILNIVFELGAKPNIRHVVVDLGQILSVLLSFLPLEQIDIRRIAKLVGIWRGRFSDELFRAVLLTLIQQLNELSRENGEDEMHFLDIVTAGIVTDSIELGDDISKACFRFVNWLLSFQQDLGRELFFNTECNYNILPRVYAICESGSYAMRSAVFLFLVELFQMRPNVFEDEYHLNSDDSFEFTEDTLPPSLKILTSIADSANDDKILLVIATLTTIQHWFLNVNHLNGLNSLFAVSGVLDLLHEAVDEGSPDTMELARRLLQDFEG